jgi:hypothetical protein
MSMSIAIDCDRDGDMSAKANSVTAYQTYLRDVRGGIVGDMGLTVGRFQNLLTRTAKV